MTQKTLFKHYGGCDQEEELIQEAILKTVFASVTIKIIAILLKETQQGTGKCIVGRCQFSGEMPGPGLPKQWKIFFTRSCIIWPCKHSAWRGILTSTMRVASMNDTTGSGHLQTGFQVCGSCNIKTMEESTSGLRLATPRRRNVSRIGFSFSVLVLVFWNARSTRLRRKMIFQKWQVKACLYLRLSPLPRSDAVEVVMAGLEKEATSLTSFIME